MESDYIKGKEIGQIMQGLKDLGRNVDTGFDRIDKKFDSFDCPGNKEKINILVADLNDRKDTKKFIFRSIFKKLMPVLVLVIKSVSIIGVVAGTVYAFVK